MSQPPGTPAIVPALFYKDPRAALAFLQKAFGFEPDMLIEDETGALVHSQMSFGNGKVMVGTEWSETHRSPASLDGRNSQTTHIYLNESVDAHCARAEAAGAKILARPETQFYGDRTYRAADPEGHMWTFSEPVTVVEPGMWDKQMNFKTWTRDKS
jgi:uncharacterized glyoxalase superfamily protein PhnB